MLTLFILFGFGIFLLRKNFCLVIRRFFLRSTISLADTVDRIVDTFGFNFEDWTKLLKLKT